MNIDNFYTLVHFKKMNLLYTVQLFFRLTISKVGAALT